MKHVGISPRSSRGCRCLPSSFLQALPEGVEWSRPLQVVGTSVLQVSVDNTSLPGPSNADILHVLASRPAGTHNSHASLLMEHLMHSCKMQAPVQGESLWKRPSTNQKEAARERAVWAYLHDLLYGCCQVCRVGSCFGQLHIVRVVGVQLQPFWQTSLVPRVLLQTMPALGICVRLA